MDFYIPDAANNQNSNECHNILQIGAWLQSQHAQILFVLQSPYGLLYLHQVLLANKYFGSLQSI